MNYANDQLIAAQKTNVEAFADLSEKAFSSFEKLVELNMAATKALLGEAITNLQALSSVKDAKELLALQSGMVKPMAEKAASYSRHVYEIIASSNADLSKVFESTSAESQKTVKALLETSLNNAPAGSEAAVAVIKSAMAASSNVVEAAQKPAKHATNLVQTNINAAPASIGEKVE
jgi:phasin family protein